MTTIKPLDRRLLVQPILTQEEIRASGIVIPENFHSKHLTARYATVLAWADDCRHPWEKGSTIAFSPMEGHEHINAAGQTTELIIDEDRVFAIFPKENPHV